MTQPTTKRNGLYRDIVVVGASAGGVEALRALVRTLPPDLPAAMLVVLHLSPNGESQLPELLASAGRLPAAFSEDGEPLELGRVYVAPPDMHLLVEPERVRVIRGPKQNRTRPAIDPLFRSAALAYGPQVIGIVLSGLMGDGTAGLHAIKQRGGTAIVQDPSDALFPDMPRNALSGVSVDHSVPVSQMAALLGALMSEPVPRPASGPTNELSLEVRSDAGEPVDMGAGAKPSAFSCPECEGVLWEIDDPDLVRFRCRVGHGFSSESLRVHQDGNAEDALWAAVRSLEEGAGLSRRLAARLRKRGNGEQQARGLEEKAREKTLWAAQLRDLLRTRHVQR